MRKLVLLILLMFLLAFGSAHLISDQGTSVTNSTGGLLSLGNLTISIHDSASGGNVIFSSTTESAIVNGSWNLMINPTLQYGISYWKDYEINGEDLDFDGNERLEFQSGLGYINNFSFINLSLINSCPSGSAIRLIYANGSVECQSSSNSSSTVDLTNYALKNQSETFVGNITTTHSGLFGFLGSLASRITKLFVTDIDASGNIEASGNVSATYFIGDGSLLTNLPSAGAESDPIFVAENSTLWSAINSKLAQTNQLYNETALILSVNRTTNIMSLGFYNTTQINSLIAASGNLSFNQSLTDSLYYSITNPSNFVNNSGLSTYNDTSLILTTNSSLWSYINSNSGSWSSTFNLTYNNLLGQQCSSGYFVNGTLANGTLVCQQVSSQAESDPLWTANSSSVLYIANLPLANRTISHISNITGFSFNYNQTVPANSYTDSINSTIVNWVDAVFVKIANVFNRTEIQNQYYNRSDIIGFGYVNSSGLSNYNETNLINSINQTLSSLKLDSSDQRYNDTALVLGINRTGNIQALGFYNVTQVNSLLSTAGNASFNQSLTNTLYYSISNPNNLINHTQAGIYNDSVIVLSVNSTLWNYIISNQAGWNSTFNSTYNNLLGQRCGGGQVVNGTLSNGTLICTTDATGSGASNSFNQVLNTTSNVTFANITVTSNSVFANNISASSGFFNFLGSALNRITKIFVTDLDVANNINASGNVTANFYFGSLNRSTFPTSSCSGTDKVVSILANGTVSCGTDLTGAGSGVSFATFNMTTSDISTTDNVNYVEVLTLPLSSGQNIMIECTLLHDSSATGTGVHYDSVLTGTSSVRQVMEYYSSATAQAICQGTAATLTCSPTSSSGTTVTPNRLYVYAVMSGSGTFTLNVKSETSNAVSVRAGSSCRSIET